MKRWKQLICLMMTAIMMALALPAGAETAGTSERGNQVTMEELEKLNGGREGIHLHNGKLTFLEGRSTEEIISGPEDAARVLETMTGLTGGDGKSRLEYLRTAEDTAGNRYHIFQQMMGDTTVLGGAAKVITDREGRMIGLSSSVESKLPEAEEAEGISAGEAEEIAIRAGGEQAGKALHAIPETTEKIILPLVISASDDENNLATGRFVWVVFTENPNSGRTTGTDLPYLAHYVTMSGEYLYSLPTVRPGDEASRRGFGAEYVFEFMEPAEYTGYVDLSDGTEKEITVTVMRDSRTGMYYLGDPQRRIIVADCYEFLYNDGNVKLEFSPDNREWDQTALLSLYNYSRAWDYYSEIGWKGGDGRETPIMILSNFCDRDHLPVDNAAYIGYALGWQLFAASRINDLSQCLDVIAHEYTHCVTEAVMTYSPYQNDAGAINEAMSDIQGNLCEMMMKATEDTTWILGENGKNPVRSMSDPHRFQQPEHVWDLYYKAEVQTPTMLNDVGGVHSNSSLLNRIAWRLCEEGGMTLEEGRAFWFAVGCAMVPGTDYAQLSEILPWALKTQGMGKYLETLEAAIRETGIGGAGLPEEPAEDRAIVTLTLPEGEKFTDGNWSLIIASLNIEKITEILQAESENEESELFGLTEIETEEMTGEEAEELLNTLGDLFGDALYLDQGAAGADGRTIQMMTRPGLTIPILLHASVNDEGTVVREPGAAIWMSGRWFGLTDVIEVLNRLEKNPEEADFSELLRLLENEALQNVMLQALFHLGDLINDPAAFLRVLAYEIKGGETNEIPAEGLEKIRLSEIQLEMPEEAAAAEARLSRPKE